MFHIGGKIYELVQNHKNGWNPTAFQGRYSEVLDRYDYIIGDWGYNQLRLKGFYREGHPKANKDTSIMVLSDYINEYCNFGCAYFVLQRVQGAVGAHVEPLHTNVTGKQELQEGSDWLRVEAVESGSREHQQRDLKQRRERFKRLQEDDRNPHEQREAKGGRADRSAEQRDRQPRFAREQGKYSERKIQAHHGSAKSDSGS